MTVIETVETKELNAVKMQLSTGALTIRPVSATGTVSTSYVDISAPSADDSSITIRPGGAAQLYVNGNGAGVGGNATTKSKFVITSTTQAFLPPRMTTAQKNAISSPDTGSVVYDSSLNKLCVYTGAAWETITSA